MEESKQTYLQTPPCQYYHECGGCSMQQYTPKKYYEVKHNIIKDVVYKSQNKAKILPIIEVGEGQRRRVEFKISVAKNAGSYEISLGFFKHQSHNIVDIQKCLVAEQAINEIIQPLKGLILSLKKPGQVFGASVASLKNGLEIILKTHNKITFEEDIFVNFVKANSVTRFYLNVKEAENISLFDSKNSIVEFDKIDLEVPLGGFLQATNKGQEAIIDFIKNHKGDVKTIADIYSGCGTYTIPLLKLKLFVSSYEGNPDMVSSLVNNIKSLGLERFNNSEVRDLYKSPLRSKKIDNYDLIIINPPRVGAGRQILEIAKSGLQNLIYISCDKKTFVEDMKILLDSGFNLKVIQGIDQFYWSKHIEIASFFERK